MSLKEAILEVAAERAVHGGLSPVLAGMVYEVSQQIPSLVPRLITQVETYSTLNGTGRRERNRHLIEEISKPQTYFEKKELLKFIINISQDDSNSSAQENLALQLTATQQVFKEASSQPLIEDLVEFIRSDCGLSRKESSLLLLNLRDIGPEATNQILMSMREGVIEGSDIEPYRVKREQEKAVEIVTREVLNAIVGDEPLETVQFHNTTLAVVDDLLIQLSDDVLYDPEDPEHSKLEKTIRSYYGDKVSPLRGLITLSALENIDRNDYQTFMTYLTPGNIQQMIGQTDQTFTPEIAASLSTLWPDHVNSLHFQSVKPTLSGEIQPREILIPKSADIKIKPVNRVERVLPPNPFSDILPAHTLGEGSLMWVSHFFPQIWERLKVKGCEPFSNYSWDVKIFSSSRQDGKEVLKLGDYTKIRAKNPGSSQVEVTFTNKDQPADQIKTYFTIVVPDRKAA
jgi:hypothetical protein